MHTSNSEADEQHQQCSPTSQQHCPCGQPIKKYEQRGCCQGPTTAGARTLSLKMQTSCAPNPNTVANKMPAAAHARCSAAIIADSPADTHAGRWRPRTAAYGLHRCLELLQQRVVMLRVPIVLRPCHSYHSTSAHEHLRPTDTSSLTTMYWTPSLSAPGCQPNKAATACECTAATDTGLPVAMLQQT
jgi:hypothetical protein